MTFDEAIQAATDQLQKADEKVANSSSTTHMGIADRYLAIAGHLRQAEYDKLTMANPEQ